MSLKTKDYTHPVFRMKEYSLTNKPSLFEMWQRNSILSLPLPQRTPGGCGIDASSQKHSKDYPAGLSNSQSGHPIKPRFPSGSQKDGRDSVLSEKLCSSWNPSRILHPLSHLESSAQWFFRASHCFSTMNPSDFLFPRWTGRQTFTIFCIPCCSRCWSLCLSMDDGGDCSLDLWGLRIQRNTHSWDRRLSHMKTQSNSRGQNQMLNIGRR